MFFPSPNMQRTARPGSLDFPQPQPQMQSSPSFSADRNLMSPSSSSLTSPPSVAPDPAYIAASAASQIVTSDHQSQIDDWFNENRNKVDAETAVVSPASLILVNAFLDQLLFSILSCSRSTSIISLRPAVTEVLKPRLAKDAIDGADDELREFLGGGDDEELSVFHNGQESRGKWDVNLVWRRTRLRCMVYTRLGDMEEEDEEMFIERERLEDAAEDHRRLSRELGIISPAAAIFLTSILEFIGEHALMVAGEAAFNRREIRQLRNSGDPLSNSDSTTRVVVEDIDMEKLAFNTTLGRLWRSWKKRVRSPSISLSRPISRDHIRKRTASLSASPSVSEVDESLHDIDPVPRSSVAEVLREEQEPNIYNTSFNSDELVIGLAKTTWSNGRGMQESSATRPRSMMMYSQPLDVMPVTILPDANSPNGKESPAPEFVPSRWWHQRSSSLPTPERGPYVSPLHEGFFTPMEGPQGGQSQGQEYHPVLDEDPSAKSDIDGAPKATSTHPDSEKGVDSKLYLEEAGRLEGYGAELSSPPKLSRLAQYLPHAMPIGYEEDPQLSVSGKNGKDMNTITTQDSDDDQYPPPISRKPRAKLSGGVPETPLNSPADGNIPMGLAIMQGQQLRNDEIRPEKSLTLGKHKAALGYEDHPIPHSDPTSNQPSIPRKELPLRVIPTKASGHHPSALDHGAPPLTPLRELVEAAHDTSDDSSSLAPSHDTQKPEVVTRTEPLPNQHEPPSPESLNSSSITPAKRSSRANHIADLRKELPSVNTAGTERAAVQRITPPSPVLLARDSLGPMVRTSTSSNRPHTSASGTSQFSHKIKALMGRDSTEGNRQHVLTRSSSDDSGTASDGQSTTKPPLKGFDKRRSFEELMKSDETIQYTLTPKNMRDMEMNKSSRTMSGQPETREVTDINRATGESADLDSSRAITGRTVVAFKTLNGLRSNPPLKIPVPSPVPSRSPSSMEKGQRTSSPSLLGRSSPAIPRDPRGKKENMADFADFIRSTGPESERESSHGSARLLPGVVSRSDNLLHANSRISSAPERSHSGNSTNGRSGSIPGTTGTAATSKRFKSKLQAREPTVSYRDQSSDLIDFIRQGPSADRGDNNYRMPRTVAPFRNTMDSDEIQDLGSGKAKETRDARSSVASTQDSFAASKSIPSSLNSRTALIDNSNRPKARNASAPVASNAPRRDEPPHPTRKQHRNKDPYAMDTDSDEDEHAITPQPREHEENLIEFLRNLDPPSAKTALPLTMNDVQKPTRNTLQKGSSGSSLRDRLAQKGGSPSSSKTSNSKHHSRPSSNASNNRRNNEVVPQLPPLSPRATSPHLVTQMGNKIDSYMPTQPTYAPHLERERNRPRRTQQARMEREPNSGLGELADFLKNSGPPTPPPEKSSPVIRPIKEESGFIKIFSRKKKLSGRA